MPHSSIDPTARSSALRFARGALLVCAVLVGGRAFAVEYETEINVSAELDLQDLYEQNEISEETLEALLELMRTGVDLNSATREELYQLPNLTYADVDAILNYRQLKGSIADPLELVTAGAIDAGKMEKLAAFLTVYPVGTRIPINGSMRLVSRYTLQDPTAPPAYFQTRLKLPMDLSAGVMLMSTRYVVGPVSYDPVRNALTAYPATYGVRVPRFFVRWKSGHADLFAGTYRIGFGERVTLNTTGRYTPDGFYYDDSVRTLSQSSTVCRQSPGELGTDPCEETRDTYTTPDFTQPVNFRGVAAALRDLSLSDDAQVSFYAFGSFQERSVYQYQTYNREFCPDPRDDSSRDCASPPVYVRNDDPLAPTSQFIFTTLPSVFNEAMGGGHATLKLFHRWEIGMTGYYAAPIWAVPGIELDVQEWAPYPFAGPFGAVGVDTSIKLGELSFFAEVTRSFDSQPSGEPLGLSGRSGGGFAALQRTTYGTKEHEVELSLRYYDREFVNPYARTISAPDMFEGQRARNELGARLRYTGKFVSDLKLRASLDFWVLPEDADRPGTAGTPNLYGLVRADYDGWRFLKIAGWVDYRNKDIRSGGHGQCYADSEIVVSGEPQPCSGEFYRFATRIRFTPIKQLTVSAQYQHTLLDDPAYPTSFRQDRTTWMEVRVRPSDEFAMRARVRYLSGAIDLVNRLEESVWGLVDFTWMPSRAFNATVRYDIYAFIDQRDSTLQRSPNPEHRFRLEFESRF